jgi:hypothetical protein
MEFLKKNKNEKIVVKKIKNCFAQILRNWGEQNWGRLWD